MVWHDLGLNPGLPDHWRTLYPLGQWAGSFSIYNNGHLQYFDEISDYKNDTYYQGGVMGIVVGNGHGNSSSNPGQEWLHFT